MTQEEKQLLFKDLCSRLPYGVKCSITKKGVVRELKPMNNGISMPVNQVCDVTVKKTLNTDIVNDFVNDNIVLKPYLRPMSSMTEEEKEELCKLCDFEKSYNDRDYFSHYGIEIISEYCVNGEKIVESTINYNVIDFFYAHHLDWRGLIPMGLALEAPEDMHKQ